MESLQQIKGRIKSVKNINQITKAMELVAATKMRKSQEIALASRPYAFTALDFLATLSKLDGVTLPPLLTAREVKRRAVILVTSDKGLAGSFNSNVIRAFEKFVKREGDKLAAEHAHFVGVGQKAAQYLEKNMKLCKKFVRVGDYTTVDEVRPIAELVIDEYLKGNWDEVIIFSAHFKNALQQDVIERRVLPVTIEDIKKTLKEIVPVTGRFSDIHEPEHASHNGLRDYLIEPSAGEILSDLARHLILMQIYHVILEANASEHAARRLAMKNASDNAEDLAGGLTLAYNKSRQASITREIIEIVAGAESLK